MKKVLLALIIYFILPSAVVFASPPEEPILRAEGYSPVFEANKRVWDLINRYVDPNYHLHDDYGEGTMSAAQEEELRSEATRVVYGCSDTYDKVKAVYTYVADRTYYDLDSTDCYPYEVYKSQRAVCQGYAALANYMLQSVGVPSMMVRSDYHVYNTSYCKELGRWVVFDSTWGCGNSYKGDYVTGVTDDSFFDMSIDDLSRYDNHEVYYVEGIVGGTGSNRGYYTLDTGFQFDKSDMSGVEWSDTGNWFLVLSGAVNGKTVKAVDNIAGFNVKEIREFEFDGSKIEHVDLTGSNIESIGSGAFRDCKKLKSVIIGSSVKSVGGYAFSGCSSLKFVDMSRSGVTKVGRETFYNCKSLSSVRLPGSLASIGSYAFTNTKIKSLNLSSTKVNKIGAYAFEGCKKLKSISIPNTLTTIGDNAFNGCSSLSSFRGSKQLKNIRYGAFGDCNKLKTVKLYKKTKVAKSAFPRSVKIRRIR